MFRKLYTEITHCCSTKFELCHNQAKLGPEAHAVNAHFMKL